MEVKMGDQAERIRSTDTDQTIAEHFDAAVADAGQPAADCASTSERLEYLAAMIASLHDLARAVPQSSLPSILDSALTEARFQLIRCAK